MCIFLRKIFDAKVIHRQCKYGASFFIPPLEDAIMGARSWEGRRKEWKEGKGMGESSVESDKNRIQSVLCLLQILYVYAMRNRNTTG